MKEKILKFWGFFLDLIFPPVCLVCRQKLTKTSSQSERESERQKPVKILAGDLSGGLEKKLSLICHSCSQRIKINTAAFCPVCSRRLPENKNTCHQDSLFILAAAGFYGDEALGKLIALLKYQKIKQAAVPLGEILTQYLKNLSRFYQLDIENFLIIPIPLHRRKENQRGFNQTCLIADQLVKNTGLTAAKNILKRTKNTASQVELKDKEKREINVSGCFAVENPELLFQKNVIILDDVFTTGATMKEAASAIKKAGAKKIIGLVIAKT